MSDEPSDELQCNLFNFTVQPFRKVYRHKEKRIIRPFVEMGCIFRNLHNLRSLGNYVYSVQVSNVFDIVFVIKMVVIPLLLVVV